MSFTVAVATENAAFSDAEGGAALELALILDSISNQFREEGFTQPAAAGTIRDTNGYVVGSWHYER